VPQQLNGDDCGIYIIHFAERILAQRERFRQLLQTSNADVEIDWQTDTIPLLREMYYSWLTRGYIGMCSLVVLINEMERIKLLTDVCM
jgi:hypothetical protein